MKIALEGILLRMGGALSAFATIVLGLNSHVEDAAVFGTNREKPLELQVNQSPNLSVSRRPLTG